MIALPCRNHSEDEFGDLSEGWILGDFGTRIMHLSGILQLTDQTINTVLLAEGEQFRQVFKHEEMDQSRLSVRKLIGHCE